ncbi:MAG: hypothetical protein POH28_01070 [Acidocella sp.]|nr:hypothetical protein [Acidocella sp.]
MRYVLNFPGHLAGDLSYKKDEIVFGYSTVLAEAAGAAEQILFIPASDTSIFKAESPRERQGTCFWAMKYRLVHGGETLSVTDGSVEITREQENSQTPEEIAELFRSSELFYTYENTALALEAALCLCPTVFLPNQWLTEAIAMKEMGMDGFAWGTDAAEIARAKATVHLARDRYLSNYYNFWDQLSNFIIITQSRAKRDSLRWGAPRAMAWRVRWQPRIETFIFLIRRTIETFRREGVLSVGFKVRRKLVRFMGVKAAWKRR